MSWEMHEAAKKIAEGWYSELEANRKRNAVLGRENVKLRELVAKMARALGVNSEWCYSDCEREFDCHEMDECPIEVSMKELGVEVRTWRE